MALLARRPRDRGSLLIIMVVAVAAMWTPRATQAQRTCTFLLKGKTDTTRELAPSHEGVEGQVHVHYHIQHHAVTTFIKNAWENHECGAVACGQSGTGEDPECLASLDERAEAAALMAHNWTIVMYETKLPQNFPLPFVDPELRRKFFFTTIMRNPLDRLLSALMKKASVGKRFPEVREAGDFTNHFATSFLAPPAGKGGRSYKDDDNYASGAHDDLALRWLGGVHRYDTPTLKDLHRAKCRLDGFDFIGVFPLLDLFHKGLCSPTLWRYSKGLCAQGRQEPHAPNPAKQWPILVSKLQTRFNESQLSLFGVYVGRNLLSFELYDYARGLAIKHLVKHGLLREEDVPEMIPSVFETLDAIPWGETTRKTIRKVWQQSQSEVQSHKETCAEMHAGWARNADVLPLFRGIGASANKQTDSVARWNARFPTVPYGQKAP